MKRKLDVISQAIKRTRFNNELYVTASQLRNYMLGDTLPDWLDVYESKSKSGSFVPFLMEKGNVFEKEIVSELKTLIRVVEIQDAFDSKSVEIVKNCIKNRVEVIANAPLINKQNKTRGIADLIIRNDVLKDLFDVPVGTEEYSIIDIKYSTVPILKNGSIGNSKAMPAYKAQIRVYSEALGLIQGSVPRYGYILGNRYKSGKNISKSLETLGVIDYHTTDLDYVDKTKKAIEWYRSVLRDGWNWKIGLKDELRPNMCVFNWRWQIRKQEIAEENFDITSVWQCGSKHRSRLARIGIDRWDDPRCNSFTLGFSKKSSYYHIVNNILRVNKRNRDTYLPKRILTKVPIGTELFVDFETVPSVVSGLERSIIFMIGIGFKTRGEWDFRSFCVDELTLDAESRIFQNFRSFVRKFEDPTVFYWHAEENILSQSGFRLDVKFFDLCKFFQKEAIVIRGCLNFGLKNVAKHMKAHGLIETELSGECQNGMSAMLLSLDLAKNREHIQKYNEFDCKVLSEILTFVREISY